MTSPADSPNGVLDAPPLTTTRGLTIFGCELDEATLFRDLAPRAGIVPTITAAPPTADTARLAGGGRWVSVGHKSRIDEATLAGFRRAGVRYLSTRSAGSDHIDLAAAARLGITVGTVAYSPDGVADHTLMLLLMAVRGARAGIHRTDAHDYRLPPARARELRDLVAGVVGTGRIGRAVAQRLRAFGCRILTHDTRAASSTVDVPLDDLLRRSDVVTLHTPLTPETHHLLDARRVALLRPGAVLVNTARGGLVDTAALLAALESGRIGGAALDVVEGEEGIFYADHRTLAPDPVLARLRALPQVVLTPHTAFHSERALRDTVEATLAGCLAFEEDADV